MTKPQPRTNTLRPKVSRSSNTAAQHHSNARAWLRQQAQPFKKTMHGIVALSVLQFLVQMLGLFMLAQILATAVMAGAAPSPWQIAQLAVVFAAQLALAKGVLTAKTRLSLSVNNHFNGHLKAKLERQSLAMIRDHSVATWQSYFLNRIPALQNYYCDYAPQQQLAAIIPVFVLAATLPYSWLVTLVLMVAAPLIPVFMWIVGVGAAAVHRQQFKAIERLSSVFLDRLNARQLLHVFQRVDAEQAFFSDASEDLKRRTMKVVSLAFLSSSVLDFFATIAMALVAVFIGFNLLGELSFGAWQSGLTLHEAMFLLLLTPLFFKELKTLGRYYHTKADAEGAAEDLMVAMGDDETLAKPVATTGLPLDLRQFSVVGQDGTEIVRSEYLLLYPGDHVLLRGPSGSGKSTLLEGLLGLRPRHAEQVSCGLTPHDVAWLTQTPVILPGSVRDNLCLDAQFNDAHIQQALSQVELDDWLAQLPHGLDTMMGDYPPLSGGQRQRLAIARMLLFNKPIVFLDEPTANLAEDQKHRIEALLEHCFQDKTVVWVAHDRAKSTFFTDYWHIDANGVVNHHNNRVLACNGSL